MRKNDLKTGAASLAIGAFLLFQTMGFPSVADADEVTIIGNKDIPVNSLSVKDIKSIFLGEKVKWDNGQGIVFVLLMTNIHEDFLRQYVGSTPSQYRQYWKKMIFTGRARSPRSYKTPDKIIDFVSKTGGAIGYIPSGRVNDDVKTFSVK